MAIASVTIRCNVCGREFEHRRKLINRTEADSYETWAAGHIDTCPDCFAAQKKAEARAKAEEALKEAKEILRDVEFPPINGVSEKQIAYASSLRESYIGKYPMRLRNAAIQKAGVEAIQNDPQKAEETEAQMRDLGKSPQEGWYEFFTYFGEYATEYMILTESDAGTIIRALKYKA